MEEGYLEYQVRGKDGESFGAVVLNPLEGYLLLAQAILQDPMKEWRLLTRSVKVEDLSADAASVREEITRSSWSSFAMEPKGQEDAG